MEFNNLSTVQFQKKMKPAAIEIYKMVFPCCKVQDLKEHGVNVHILDKEFGVDALIHFKGGQWVSIQEKYRENRWLSKCDFTQEYINGFGTLHERPGEWFKLGAQLYFYGWADKTVTFFEKWAILDVAKYKILVEKLCGLHKIGKYFQNNKHGKATFYAIPIQKLEPCFYTDYRKYVSW